MIEILMCGYNLTCSMNTINDIMGRPKYPPDVSVLCQYFADNKVELPEYCIWKTDIKKPRHRSEY